MKDWNGREIAIARSKGGVIVTASFFDNLVSTDILPWPPSEIVQKAYQSRHIKFFTKDQVELATCNTGYYCDLQSVHSEDAITWSVFGTIARADKHVRTVWLQDFFSLLGFSGASTQNSEIFIWRRIPHPETLVSGGPEIDFGILTEDTVVLGEAKWQSGVAQAQGKHKNKNQIQLRKEYLSTYWKRISPQVKNMAVAFVGLKLSSICESSDICDIPVINVSWDQVCLLKSHPLQNELMRYLEWKKANS